ncbi:MAG: SDR family oxidoreductase [Burkholderiaceae bacterium]|nr:SDR family oxidoreductase [Burkholderiaceae bacterium]
MLLKDKVCVIAGAASLRSIGYATAELFAEHGAKVVIVDVIMNEIILEEVRSSIEAKVKGSVTVHGLRCDISKAEDCDKLIRDVLALHGTIDCLVNSAGIVRSKPFLEINEKELDLMFDINLKGAFFLCQSVLKVFVEKRSGTIVNVSSLAAQRGGGLVGGSHYAASKGGMLSMTKSIAREFGALGIRANAICPTMIETPMLDGLSEERLRGIIDAIPLKRTGTTREAAGACLFLASELSGFVTGATIDVNGGTHIH